MSRQEPAAQTSGPLSTESSSGEGSPILSVILGRYLVWRGPLRVATWRLVGLVAGSSSGETADGRCVRRDEEGEDYLWTGFPLRLDRGAVESYWFNLVSEKPSLFVICRPVPDPGLAPTLVTPDQDLASAHMEADDTVFSAAMPAEVVPQLEQFVMAHYRPQPRADRRRSGRPGEGGGHG